VAGSLRSEARAVGGPLGVAGAGAEWAHERWGVDWPSSVTAGMRRQLEELPSAGGGRDAGDANHAGGERVPDEVAVPDRQPSPGPEREPEPAAATAGPGQPGETAGSVLGPAEVGPGPGGAPADSTPSASPPAKPAPPAPPHPETLDGMPPVGLGYEGQDWLSELYPRGLWDDLPPQPSDRPPAISPPAEPTWDDLDEDPHGEEPPLPLPPAPTPLDSDPEERP
jgi:hypothetical protein